MRKKLKITSWGEKKVSLSLILIKNANKKKYKILYNMDIVYNMSPHEWKDKCLLNMKRCFTQSTQRPEN